MIKITLTAREIRWGREVAMARHWRGMDYKDANGCTMGHKAHVIGCHGEQAVAKALDRYWSGHVDTWKGPDLSSRMQVRARSGYSDDLFVFPKDNSDHYFVLVTGLAPELWVHGYFQGHEAKQPEHYREHWRAGAGPAWIVPQGILHELRQKAVA
jgi:hypothetical protein